MNESQSNTNILIAEYEHKVASTDRFADDEITPILLGLFGEVGSVMSTSKKLHREKTAFAGYRCDLEEEFGDTLWYLAALCRRLKINLSALFSEALEDKSYTVDIAANNVPGKPIAKIINVSFG